MSRELPQLQSTAQKLIHVDRFHYQVTKPRQIELPYSIRIFLRDRPASQLGGALHNQHTLVLPLQVPGIAHVAGNAIRLQPGMALLILPRQFHEYANVQERNVLWLFCGFKRDEGRYEALRNTPVTLGPGLVRSMGDLLEAYHANAQSMPIITKPMPDKPIHNAAYSESVGTSDNLQMLIALRLQIVLEEMLAARLAHHDMDRHASGHRSESKKDLPSGPHYALSSKGSQLADQACHYIFDNLNNEVTLEETARHLHVSPGHLRNEFAQYTGLSFGWYIRYLRLHQASLYLDTTDMPLAQIGERCGYRSIYSFSRAFRQHAGMSPSQYRRKMRQ
jgi:AraC-like DNA-binding protein